MSSTLINAMITEIIKTLESVVIDGTSKEYNEAYQNGQRQAIIAHALWQANNIKKEVEHVG